MTPLPLVRHDDPHAQRVWAWSAPVRAYGRHMPIRKGRFFLARRLVLPHYPAGGRLTASFPDGSSVTLTYDEALGRAFLLRGHFEQAERDWLADRAAGGTAIDVGANVGYHSVGMAAAGATVIAVEPLSTNIPRLRETTAGYPSILVEETALGASCGRVPHTTPVDGAYAAVGPGPASWPMTTLDALWSRHGAPAVRVVKIDVEGYELEVVRGAGRLLSAARPAVLVETSQPAAVRAAFAGLGYHELARPAAFESWNHLFGPAPSVPAGGGRATSRGRRTRRLPAWRGRVAGAGRC